MKAKPRHRLASWLARVHADFDAWRKLRRDRKTDAELKRRRLCVLLSFGIRRVA